jgi:hypothetical protein
VDTLNRPSTSYPEQICVRVTEDMYRDIADAAKRSGMKPAVYLRALLSKGRLPRLTTIVATVTEEDS